MISPLQNRACAVAQAPRRAAIYARVSTDKQNPLSPEDQQRKCREYAQQNGCTSEGM